MDTDAPKSFPQSVRALRPKTQVLMEQWETLDRNQIFEKSMEQQRRPSIPPHETWSTLKLPYQVPSCPPLPSYNEIVAGSKTHSLRTKIGQHTIVRFGDTVVKVSITASVLSEAENILFLAENCPQLRIPKVLAVWKDTILNGGQVFYCMMMEFIEGIQLREETVAGVLPGQALDIVCAKVSAQIRLLRSLPSEGYYGRVHRQGWMEQPPGLSLFPKRKLCGPYNTYEEFCSAMYDSYEKDNAGYQNGIDWDPGFESETAQIWSMLANWNPQEPKFTWLDPKFSNIIARPIQKDDGTEDWDVFLLDWECAGWYPAWLQSMQCNFRSTAYVLDRIEDTDDPVYRNDEIKSMLLKDFDPNPEQKNIEALRSILWKFY